MKGTVIYGRTEVEKRKGRAWFRFWGLKMIYPDSRQNYLISTILSFLSNRFQHTRFFHFLSFLKGSAPAYIPIQVLKIVSKLKNSNEVKGMNYKIVFFCKEHFLWNNSFLQFGRRKYEQLRSNSKLFIVCYIDREHQTNNPASILTIPTISVKLQCSLYKVFLSKSVCYFFHFSNPFTSKNSLKLNCL